VANIPVLEISPDAQTLHMVLSKIVIPSDYEEDTPYRHRNTSGMDVLLTWNFSPSNNTLKARIINLLRIVAMNTNNMLTGRILGD
jgi:hypothetical protein